MQRRRSRRFSWFYPTLICWLRSKAGTFPSAPRPIWKRNWGACSLDLRLGDEFRVFERARTAFIDPREGINWDAFTRVVTVPAGEPFIMHPNELVLAATVEEIALPADMLGRLEGRSSLGRLGHHRSRHGADVFPRLCRALRDGTGQYRPDAGRALSQYEDLFDDLRAHFRRRRVGPIRANTPGNKGRLAPSCRAIAK